MINQDRIVQVTAIDLISLYGLILQVGGEDVTAVQATDPGQFALTEGSGNLLAAEPVQTFDFGEDVTSAVLYFVASYDYEGFTVAGEAVTTSGVEVNPDGSTLYTATLADGAITIAQIGF